MPAGTLSMPAPTPYAAMPVLPHMPAYAGRPPSQLVRFRAYKAGEILTHLNKLVAEVTLSLILNF